MSNVGKSQLPGEWSKPRAPLPKEQDILDKVKEEFEHRRNSPISKFLALLVRTQTVDGTKYLFLVDIGESENICLFVFLPLYQEPNLEQILKATKIDEDPLDL
ncbi:leukocyte cysteine proteinase inhibitor 1-like [Aquarana catesbeiana]|uniref:leukocyte cysteine proteinase inhibitor 1-like n=1 Tax=Aquarana catesbeiana TaxID=8400 RepID=UPI003CC9675A